MNLNFSWLEAGKVAGSARPGRPGRNLRQDLDFLHAEGVRAIMNVTAEAAPDIAGDTRFSYLYLPVWGFSPPTQAQIDEAMLFIEQQKQQGGGVLVHCAEGVGRTGTVLACYLVYHGQNASDAIKNLRKVRPNSVEHSSQMEAIYSYAKRLNRG